MKADTKFKSDLQKYTQIACDINEEKFRPINDLWVDYNSITNEYMNSAFIGTIRVYVE